MAEVEGDTSEIYARQERQLAGAYARELPVSWRLHPLSPLTPSLLSYARVTADGQKEIKIVDLGSGAGEKTTQLASCGVEVVGVDILDKPLRQALNLTTELQLNGAVGLLRADLRILPFVKEAFDGAHDYLTFLHMVKSDWPRYVESVHRILKPGAPLLVVTFSGNDPDFYGYPIDKLEDRGIIFSGQYYQGDKQRVHHLIGSYFYFPKEAELREAFAGHFAVIQMQEIPHPLSGESHDHINRKLWHVLMRRK